MNQREVFRGTAAVPEDVRAGLAALFEVEYEPMYRLAFTMLGDDGDSEEVVQEAFVAVGSRWDTIGNPGGYLRASVVNGARKRMRSAGRRDRALAAVVATTPEPVTAEGDYLLDLVDGLPERQRVAVVLTYYSGMSSVEVGEVMDCPSATVRSLLRRALTSLRQEVTA